MENRKSSHILSTSANLLGFCLIVTTSLHIGKQADYTYADECASITALLLSVSTFLSYISIRSRNKERSIIFEKAADYAFITSLIGLIGIVAFLFFNLTKKIY